MLEELQITMWFPQVKSTDVFTRPGLDFGPGVLETSQELWPILRPTRQFSRVNILLCVLLSGLGIHFVLCDFFAFIVLLLAGPSVDVQNLSTGVPKPILKPPDKRTSCNGDV